jgi:hypothetical protein
MVDGDKDAKVAASAVGTALTGRTWRWVEETPSDTCSLSCGSHPQPLATQSWGTVLGAVGIRNR